MVISHKYKFIFVKTLKTAGTSTEVFLSQVCDDNDIFTPVIPHVEPHIPRNYTSIWNPFPEIFMDKGKYIDRTFKQLLSRKKFYNHIHARYIRARIPSKQWKNYFKFCVERNPWDKTLSHYYMLRSWSGGKLTLDEYFANKQYCLNYPFYTSPNGEVMVDRILKYENLNIDLAEVFSHLGIPFHGSLGVSAKSEHRKEKKHYRDMFSANQTEIVTQVFQKEIEMHGYKY